MRRKKSVNIIKGGKGSWGPEVGGVRKRGLLQPWTLQQPGFRRNDHILPLGDLFLSPFSSHSLSLSFSLLLGSSLDGVDDLYLSLSFSFFFIHLNLAILFPGFREEKEEKIPHMCKSIGHQTLRGCCPAVFLIDYSSEARVPLTI